MTVVSGLEGGPPVLDPLARALKARCGAGGSVKDDAIEIQGDHVAAVLSYLGGQGYRPKRSGG